MPSTSPEQEKQLQHNLGAVVAPIGDRQHFMDKRASLQCSKHAANKTFQSSAFFDKRTESKISSGSVAEQLMQLLRNDDVIKFAAFFCDYSKTNYVKISKCVSLVLHKETTGQDLFEIEIPANDKFHENKIILMNELKIDGKMLIACVWTAFEESRRLKVSPWVSTWDVVQGLNSETRPFFVGLNVDPNRQSNVRTNFFYPHAKVGCLIGHPKLL